jgi:hypothetical protein
MKIYTFFFCFLAIFKIVHAEIPINSNIIKYELNLSVKNEIIKINIKNKSSFSIKIREDEMPYSLFVRGIKIYAYNESNKLEPVPLALPIGSNPELVSIRPGAEIGGEIEIKWLIPNYCTHLNKNPVIIFWSYSAHSESNVLLPKNGALRLKKEDMNCN